MRTADRTEDLDQDVEATDRGERVGEQRNGGVAA